MRRVLVFCLFTSNNTPQSARLPSFLIRGNRTSATPPHLPLQTQHHPLAFAFHIAAPKSTPVLLRNLWQTWIARVLFHFTLFHWLRCCSFYHECWKSFAYNFSAMLEVISFCIVLRKWERVLSAHVANVVKGSNRMQYIPSALRFLQVCCSNTYVAGQKLDDVYFSATSLTHYS
jgi:hypothetical protein